MRLHRLAKLVFSDEDIINNVKSKIEKREEIHIFGYQLILNKKIRKLILKPKQSLNDSKYTPEFIKSYLKPYSFKNKGSYLSDASSSDMEVPTDSEKIPHAIKNKLPLSKKSIFLQTINESLLSEKLYEKDPRFCDLIILNFNFVDLKALLTSIKREGNIDSLNNIIDRMLQLNDIYKFPFDQVVNLLEASGDIQKTKDYLIKQYINRENDPKVLYKLYTICEKYGIYQLELWCLSEFISKGNSEFLQKNEELLKILHSVNVDISSVNTPAEFLEFNIKTATPLVAYICNKILEESMYQAVTICNSDSYKIAIVGMHQGTGGSPQKAMRLASYLSNHTDNKIAYISPSVAPNNTTVQNSELLESKASVIVLDDIEVDLKTISQKYNIDVKYLNRLYPKYRKNSIFKFIDVFEKLEPTVIHVIGTLELEIQAALAAMIVGIPVIVLNPGMMSPTEYAVTTQNFLECNFNKHVLNSILKYKNVGLYNNSYVAAKSFDTWLKLGEENIENTKVLYNGIHLPQSVIDDKMVSLLRNELKVSQDEILVGIVGRLAYEKLPFNVLRAIKQIHEIRNDIKFIFVGDGVLRESIEHFIISNNLEDQASIFGFTSDMALMYRSMDLCLLVSLAEGMPNVLLEAQSFGVPVLSSDVGGCRETIKEGITGFILEDNQHTTIANSILKLLNNQKFMYSSPEACKKWIRNNFSMEKMSENAKEIYRKDFTLS